MTMRSEGDVEIGQALTSPRRARPRSLTRPQRVPRGRGRIAETNYGLVCAHCVKPRYGIVRETPGPAAGCVRIGRDSFP